MAHAYSYTTAVAWVDCFRYPVREMKQEERDSEIKRDKTGSEINKTDGEMKQREQDGLRFCQTRRHQVRQSINTFLWIDAEAGGKDRAIHHIEILDTVAAQIL